MFPLQPTPARAEALCFYFLSLMPKVSQSMATLTSFFMVAMQSASRFCASSTLAVLLLRALFSSHLARGKHPQRHDRHRQNQKQLFHNSLPYRPKLISSAKAAPEPSPVS